MPTDDQYEQAKRTVTRALRSGKFEHEARRRIEVKNLLSTGEVTPSFVEQLVARSNSTQYRSSPHHFVPSLDVHIVKSSDWYVKFYFIGEPDTVFISVHQ
ncbi:hypothetical protein [Paraburkholderia sp. BCC1886]|uniref:hypothetical protein n=1 Tax=Paraburkholderia sp. BCC1886 TaxID=2562670 RepID=UPI001183EB63|nr:hypothetical protein [Paraburkholderia sp. BCC1886]